MRLGKSVEHLQHATNALNKEDNFEKFTTIGRQTGYAIYLFWDTFAWVSRYYLFIYFYYY